MRLPDRPPKVAALIGIVLSAAIFWPGVVKETDLDARPVNAIAGLGILIAVSVTLVAAKSLARPLSPAHQPGDRLRGLFAAVALVLAEPWIAADLGLSFNGIPVLGTLYQTAELRTQPNVAGLHPAVHHGHHHGMDGVLLVLSALLLSRLISSVRQRGVAALLGAYLALMLCYGAGNIANDFWLEQVVKRGWTEWEIPNVTTPKASAAWGLIVLAAAGLWGISAAHARRSPAASGTPEGAELPR